MYSQRFFEQVSLLLKCLPALRMQNFFALKGGTAINLFFQNLPRLSVDIDLTYLPIEDRTISVNKIQTGLNEIADIIKKQNPQIIIKEQYSKENILLKLLVYTNNALVKIEPSFIMRGTLYPLTDGTLCEKVNEKFNIFLDKVPLLALPEVYAGKLCAALNRQHPRDLFDIKLLFENGGITEEIRQAFVVYLSCDVRPIHELLSPNLLDIRSVFQREFIKMTEVDVTLDDLLAVRLELIKQLKQSLTIKERQFLVSVKQGEPNFNLMSFKNLDVLPSLQWKIINIRKMDKTKQKKMLYNLQTLLEL